MLEKSKLLSKKRKPITIIFESDENLENSDVIDDMKKECMQYFPEGLDYIFAEDQKPILWLNSSLHFTIESVKMIVERLLEKLPHYEKYPLLLQKGLKIDNELTPVESVSPLEILVCDANEGAYEIASKLCQENKGAITIKNIDTPDLSMQDGRNDTVMLLYLNDEIFGDQDVQLHDSVKLLIDEGVPIILVHEKDRSKGGCPFESIINQTPVDLKEEPYNLYSNDIAVSLYSANQYQQVSLRQILQKITTKLTGDTDIKATITSTIMAKIPYERLP